MRDLIPIIRIVPVDEAYDDEWMALVSWVDDTAESVGQLATGPDEDMVRLVAELERLVQDVRWPWMRLPGQDRSPHVRVPLEMDQDLSALAAWANPKGWVVERGG